MVKTKIINIVIALVLAAGLGWGLSSLREIRQTLNNLNTELQGLRSLMVALDSTEPITEEKPAAEKSSPATDAANSPALKTTDIPTSIIFPAVSSPLLQPQNTLTITLEKISFAATENIVALHLKIFTSETDSFSALEPTPLFALFDKTTGELKSPTGATGPFSSLPPRSAVAGQILFAAPAGQNIFIFKIGAGDQTKFYEFDFEKKTYKETTVG